MTAGPALVSRVREALEKTGASAAPMGSESVAELVRATREAIAELARARAETNEAGPGHVKELQSLLHRILDEAVERPLRQAVNETPFAHEWTDLLIEAVEVSDFTVGALFLGRARHCGDRTLFLLPPRRREGRVSWSEARARMMEIGKALLALRRAGEVSADSAPVALLGANSPEIALFDLACLITGTRNVPIPANSSAPQIDFILKHSGTQALFLGDEVSARVAVEGMGSGGPSRIHWLDGEREATDRIANFHDFLRLGDTLSEQDVLDAVSDVRSSDVATVMYTSGTTGEPKGVPFTHGNLVTKRYARAASWPDIGEGDVFLCYLPLYHTFGRWLEMMACVFWGAVYAFVEDVSVESLLHAFQRVRPTTFISVPKKWIQVAEAVAPISDDVEPHAERDAKIARALVATTGGRLKRGLSAAGYLPPAVFERFHNAGIELHSGFGMTEATGGITMTPAGAYRTDSIGTALPGIELKVADDGELLIRGPYVTPPSDDEAPRQDDWFATGDIVTLDGEGHLRIIDRKKEIFKNVQGETISPRRIESLFAEFDVMERVLLIGDRREYCTVLIVPTAELRDAYRSDADDLTMDSPELRDLFAPVVSTVNRFLSPFERILDFCLLTRDLDAEAGELTAKGTPRRKLVAERFKDAIDPMYSREAVLLSVGDLPVRIPHWFLRQTGIHSREIRADEAGIEVVTTGQRLDIVRLGEGRIRVGDLEYDAGGDTLLLGEIFGRAALWLGNEAVAEFAGRGIQHWWRRGQRFQVITSLVARPLRERTATAPVTSWVGDTGLDVGRLHEFATTLRSSDVGRRREVVELLRETLTGERPDMDRLVRDVLRSGLRDPQIRGECFHALIPGLTPDELDRLFIEHLEDPSFPSEREATLISQAHLRGDQLERLLNRVRKLADETSHGAPPRRLDRFVGLLLRQAIDHRAGHLRVRSLLAQLAEDATRADVRARFHRFLDELVRGFRDHLPRARLADGVQWEDAVLFTEDVDADDRRRILDAIANTPLLSEAKALLGVAPVLDMRPLRTGAVRVRFLGTGTGRSVYLLEWFPAGPDENVPPFECIVKSNRDLDWAQIQAELRLLVRARSGASGRPVVKTQGGGYGGQGLWTEEFIPGKTLDELLRGMAAAQPDTPGPLSSPGGQVATVWPFVVSTCTSLIVDFWKRTGKRITLAHPSPVKVVLPPHDWQVGGRLVSIADRVECEKLTDVLASIQHGVLKPLMERYPDANLQPEWPMIFSAALEVLGEADGVTMLENENPADERMSAAALRFVSSVRRRGFLPGRIRHAARRYRRWSVLNPDATLEAQAATLDQIEGAYGLADLEAERPGSRLQLFRYTVFRGSDSEFVHAFDKVTALTLASLGAGEKWRTDVAGLRERFPLDGREEFFLARMLYPHVNPNARAILVREEDATGGAAAGVEVEHRDPTGDIFRIRRPANPNETSALYRVFRASNFRRVFGDGNHDLLVVTEERGRIIGGLIYRRLSPSYVNLEWVVVSRRRRGRGIGSVLLSEFLERLRVQGVKVVSTGFFRPSFFAKFEFGVDPRYAGLVRFLEPEDLGVAPEPAKGDSGA